MDGILTEDGRNTSVDFFVAFDAEPILLVLLFKHDDLKSSKLNSGNGAVFDSGNL